MLQNLTAESGFPTDPSLVVALLLVTWSWSTCPQWTAPFLGKDDSVLFPLEHQVSEPTLSRGSPEIC